MAAKFPQDFEDHVTCPICLGQYQDPRLLHCLHTYCKGCLEELLNKGLRRSSIECPECREVTEVIVTSKRFDFPPNKISRIMQSEPTWPGH